MVTIPCHCTFQQDGARQDAYISGTIRAVPATVISCPRFWDHRQLEGSEGLQDCSSVYGPTWSHHHSPYRHNNLPSAGQCSSTMQSLACQTTEQIRCRSTRHLPGLDKSQWGCRQIGNNGGLPTGAPTDLLCRDVATISHVLCILAAECSTICQDRHQLCLNTLSDAQNQTARDKLPPSQEGGCLLFSSFKGGGGGGGAFVFSFSFS